MNITESEEPVKVVAKTCCGWNDKSNNSGRKVTYSFIDDYHNLCLDKKDIISAELKACERLLKYCCYTADDIDKKIIETEISELKMTLDLMH
jgi:hypothetical protein